ncbi:hypothetical protein OAR53_07585, partial [Luminiphilus sp.]|nr:hypothetical protein [Luminiphilus sp.]
MAGHQAEVRALAAEPLVALDLVEPLVVLEPVLLALDLVEPLVVLEPVLLAPRVLEQQRQERLPERSRLLVRRLQVLVLLAWWV